MSYPDLEKFASSVSQKATDKHEDTLFTGLGKKKFDELHDLITRDSVFKIEDIPAYIDAIQHVNTVGLDDRKLLLEKLVVVLSRLQVKNPSQSVRLQRVFMGLLNSDLPIPPASYMNVFPDRPPLPVVSSSKGRRPYVFRSADGSNYNLLQPSVGRSDSPYARSVAGAHPLPKNVLPDPELIYDTLLRRDEFVQHPGGVSSLFFAFANLVIHDCFYTDYKDKTMNKTSSYLDLSILYGNKQTEQDMVRRKDGTGQLWNDVFSDSRLLLMPPASCALLVLLSRNHNYIATKLREINENGNFVSPPPTEDAAKLAQDDELFQRARLVNCGFFVQIILRDYVGAILGLARDGTDWRLDPLMAIRKADHDIVTRGEGNQVSVEFNLLYRWHTTISEEDTKWLQDEFTQKFKQDPNTISVEEFRKATAGLGTQVLPVKERTFGGLKRQPDGRFKDEDLAKAIHNATEWRAGKFKARGSPSVMRVIEIMGIRQAREWGVCTINEFRKFIGLKPYGSFKEWNPEQAIHTAAKALYKHIDNLELYVGLQAEQSKDPGPGAGLCPGYTISRAILGDAVMLTRGDRFLTSEFTPHNLTTWGFNDCQWDPADGSFGGILTKLLFRTLPDYFPSRSAYAHFPFLVPDFMKENLAKTNDKMVEKYIWTRPPLPRSTTIPLDTFAAVNQVATDSSFVSGYNDKMYKVVRATAEKHSLQAGRITVQGLLPTALSGGAWPEYFKEKIQRLLMDNSMSLVGSKSKYVDIVSDVINLLPVHLISEEIIGLPVKTANNSNGTWEERDTYQRFADVANYVFVNNDPTNEWRLRESAQKTYEDILDCLVAHIRAMGSRFSTISRDSKLHLSMGHRDSHKFIKAVREANPNASTEELASFIFAASVPTAALFAQAITHIIDYYLDSEKAEKRAEIVKLAATLDGEGSGEKISEYINEALFAKPLASGVYRTATKDVVLGATTITAGQRVYGSIAAAHADTASFGPDDKPRKAIPAFEDSGLLSQKFFASTVPAIVGTILSLKNISRGPHLSGKLASVTESVYDLPRCSYLDFKGNLTPFPLSLVVKYDI